MTDITALGASTATVTSQRGRLSSHAFTGSGGSPVANVTTGAAAAGTAAAGGSTPNSQRRYDEDVNLPLIKVVVLGASGVGKTSVVKVIG